MVRTPQTVATDTTAFSLQACPRPRCASVGAGPFSHTEPSYPQSGRALFQRNDPAEGVSPKGALAPIPRAPGPALQDLPRPKAVLERSFLIEDLRAKVRAIERPQAQLPPSAGIPQAGWTLGIGRLDAALGGPGRAPGLDCRGVHELKPEVLQGGCAATQRALVIGFALRLAARRARSAAAAPLIVWCGSKVFRQELGLLYGPGLFALGLDPSWLLVVETARAGETLWAMEEAVRANAALLVAGVLDQVDPAAARRLSLAADAGSTPALLLTHGASPAPGAVASRWRIGVRPSAPDPLDARAPGGFAASVRLERCRASPNLSLMPPQALEWCDETHRFRVPAAVADRTDENRPPAARTRGL